MGDGLGLPQSQTWSCERSYLLSLSCMPQFTVLVILFVVEGSTLLDFVCLKFSGLAMLLLQEFSLTDIT